MSTATTVLILRDGTQLSTDGLVVSEVSTPRDTRPHYLRLVDREEKGDQKDAICAVCGVWGERGALELLSPSAVGCTQVPPFQSPTPSWR